MKKSTELCNIIPLLKYADYGLYSLYVYCTCFYCYYTVYNTPAKMIKTYQPFPNRKHRGLLNGALAYTVKRAENCDYIYV